MASKEGGSSYLSFEIVLISGENKRNIYLHTDLSLKIISSGLKWKECLFPPQFRDKGYCVILEIWVGILVDVDSMEETPCCKS